MLNYLKKLWNQYVSAEEESLEVEGILSKKGDGSMLERILSLAEETPAGEWKKEEEKGGEYNDFLRIEQGIRLYITKIDFSLPGGSPYRNNEEVYMKLYMYWKINYGKNSGEPVGGMMSYRLNISTEKDILGSAFGKRIEQLFKSVEQKILSD